MDALHFLGLRIQTSELLINSKIVPRAWRERLLSWPWQPWKATRMILVPDRTYYKTGNIVTCHPAMLDELKRRIREQGLSQSLPPSSL